MLMNTKKQQEMKWKTSKEENGKSEDEKKHARSKNRKERWRLGRQNKIKRKNGQINYRWGEIFDYEKRKKSEKTKMYARNHKEKKD